MKDHPTSKSMAGIISAQLFVVIDHYKIEIWEDYVSKALMQLLHSIILEIFLVSFVIPKKYE